MDKASKVTDPFQRDRRALLVVITGPSGVGKDSVVRRVKERSLPVQFVITATDRPPRSGEVHGRDYFFYSTEEFERMIVAGELLEHARVYGQYKGIPAAQVRQALTTGQDVLLRLDVQGATTVKRLVCAAVTVFFRCESEEELIARLRQRRSESDAQLQQRLEVARQEMARIPEFDYVVVNRHSHLDAAVDDLVAIIRAEHCRTKAEKIRL